MKEFGQIILTMLFSVIIIMWHGNIVMQAIDWYNLPRIPHEQVIGLLVIKSLVFLRLPRQHDEKQDISYMVFMQIIGTLIVWSLIYFIHFFV